mmetsp:Transcript_80442/g.139612  ORF Transcript_80442/g.139612 Transcript_80442/m.139612 type:complete len:140 (+) Transcript_80442:2-421(+)
MGSSHCCSCGDTREPDSWLYKDHFIHQSSIDEFSADEVLGQPLGQAEVIEAFYISIEKGPGDHMGIGVDWRPPYMDKLLVTDVQPGLVAAWNERNPDMQVEIGDFIKEVNGMSGKAEELLEAINSNVLLEMQISRERER